MEKLDKILDKQKAFAGYSAIPLLSIQAEINKINYNADALFIGLAVGVSILAGYSVYRYFKSIKRGY